MTHALEPPRQMLQHLDLRRRSTAAAFTCSSQQRLPLPRRSWCSASRYPGPFGLAGGRDLFLLVTFVDVVLGPVLTFAVSITQKDCRTCAGIRHDRHHSDRSSRLRATHRVRGAAGRDGLRGRSASPPSPQATSRRTCCWRGRPTTGCRGQVHHCFGARAPEPGPEHNDALFKALEGTDISSRPHSGSPTSSRRRPRWRVPCRRHAIEPLPCEGRQTPPTTCRHGRQESTARFLPAMARGEWVAVLNATGDVLSATAPGWPSF